MLYHIRNEAIQLGFKFFQVKFWGVKFFLVFLVLCVTTVNSYMFVYLIMGYLNYEVVTTTQTIPEISSTFPKVTFCNKNMFQTKFALEFLKSINRELHPELNIFVLNEIENASFYDIQSASMQIYNEALKRIFANFTDSDRLKLTHDPYDLVPNCKYGDDICLIQDHNFIWYFDRIYGVCYTFNSGNNMLGMKTDLLKTKFVGSSGSFLVNFYVGSHENLTIFNSFNGAGGSDILDAKLFGGGRGAIVRIENNSYLNDDSFGFQDIQIAPGSDVTIQIRRSFKFSLPKPYSNCDIANDDIWQQEKFKQENYFYQLFADSPYQYNQQSCMVQCWQQNLIANCNCSDPRYLSLYTNVSDCLEGDFFVCQFDLQHYNWNWGQCLNLCPLECNRSTITTLVSSSELSGDFFFYLIRDKTQLGSDFETQKLNKKLALSTFVRLRIFYDSLSYELTNETPKMNLIDLIAALGGSLSLLMGMSFFTIFEVLEIFLEIYFIRNQTPSK